MPAVSTSRTSPATLIEAVRAVALSPTLVRRLVDDYLGRLLPGTASNGPLTRLTARESEVLAVQPGRS